MPSALVTLLLIDQPSKGIFLWNPGAYRSATSCPSFRVPWGRLIPDVLDAMEEGEYARKFARKVAPFVRDLLEDWGVVDG